MKFPTHLQNSDLEITITPVKTKEEKLLESMTVEEKVGQLFIFGFDGTTLTSKNKTFIQNHHLGGILIYGRNITSEKQLKQLIQDIQAISDIPLFISIDQEGGIVSRLGWNNVLTKSQASIKNPQESYTVAKARGEILKELGINMNFAPVVEYITGEDSFLYERVYMGSKIDIYQKGIAAIQGYRDADIIAVPKHFPGHSNVSEDPHYSLSIVNIARDQWGVYIQPFSKILEQTDVDAIMIGHIKFPNIDKNPASISSEIIKNRLTEALEYNGLIISDDMEMEALKEIDTPTKLAKQALIAGEDILIYSGDITIQEDVYDYIVQEVKQEDLNIDAKVLKILQTKTKYGILSIN